ncbi:hypothetical protein CBL_01108 [Carabus blaptoides fortunei]
MLRITLSHSRVPLSDNWRELLDFRRAFRPPLRVSHITLRPTPNRAYIPRVRRRMVSHQYVGLNDSRELPHPLLSHCTVSLPSTTVSFKHGVHVFALDSSDIGDVISNRNAGAYYILVHYTGLMNEYLTNDGDEDPCAVKIERAQRW